jgi:hypothetical protein
MDFKSKDRPKKLKTVGVVLIIAVTLVSWVGIIDHQSQKYVNSATSQALVAYASARGLNAIISMAQSIEVEIPVIGGFSGQPLEILDPLDDLIEQYSSVMKFSIVSLLTQKLIIEIASTTFFKIVLTFFGVCAICGIFAASGTYFSIFFKSFLFISLLRFLVVMVIMLNGIVDSVYLETKTKKDIQNMKSFSEDKQELMDFLAGNTDSKSWLTDAREKISAMTDISKFREIQTIVENKVETMLNLMVAFLFKTLIMPLVFLLFLLKGFKRIWNIDPRGSVPTV